MKLYRKEYNLLMQNILILANGDIAKHFVRWVGKSRIDENHYYITCNRNVESFIKITPNLTFVHDDPTSFLKIKRLMGSVTFSVVFIVMQDREEANYAYRNIRMLSSKIRIVLMSKWDNLELHDENLHMVSINELMAGYLYEYLPNVPVIAKNIGLGKGDIMEVLVPFGSPYAYRHVGSIVNRKWKVGAIYRNEKQILPNNATMIKPNDIMVMIGNPLVLEELYRRITTRKGVFPEPFGKHLYLILDMKQEREDILLQVNEAIFLSNQFGDGHLYIRLNYINFSPVMNELKLLESDNIHIVMNYDQGELFKAIESDTSQYDVGLFLISRNLLMKGAYHRVLYGMKRPVYIFGETSIYNITDVILLMENEREMESISASVFDLSEILNLKLNLCYYDPEGDFDEKENVIKHYESLSTLYNFDIYIKKRKQNPIKELRNEKEILHVAPYKKSVMHPPFINFFSTQISRYFMSIKKHPQLLIPFEE